MGRQRLSQVVLYSSVALSSAVTHLAHGDETLEEIVVTAQRRVELSRDVPISITSINADLLEQSGAEQLGDIANLTPGLRFDAAGSFVQPTIRGVGTAVSTSGGGPNVGIYVDGFFSANPAVAHFQLMKVDLTAHRVDRLERAIQRRVIRQQRYERAISHTGPVQHTGHRQRVECTGHVWHFSGCEAVTARTFAERASFD